MAERNSFAGRYVVKIGILLSLFVRIGVVEYPLIARQVCAVPVFGHNVFANYLNPSAALRAGLSRAVLVEIECVFV